MGVNTGLGAPNSCFVGPQRLASTSPTLLQHMSLLDIACLMAEEPTLHLSEPLRPGVMQRRLGVVERVYYSGTRKPPQLLKNNLQHSLQELGRNATRLWVFPPLRR